MILIPSPRVVAQPTAAAAVAVVTRNFRRFIRSARLMSPIGFLERLFVPLHLFFGGELLFGLFRGIFRCVSGLWLFFFWDHGRILAVGLSIVSRPPAGGMANLGNKLKK